MFPWQMAKYFTAYRIDHILGFFRIWELPEHAVTGLVGKFRPSIPLSQEELDREGIWDFDRLSKPYMQQQILQVAELFLLFLKFNINPFKLQKFLVFIFEFSQ